MATAATAQAQGADSECTLLPIPGQETPAAPKAPETNVPDESVPPSGDPAPAAQPEEPIREEPAKVVEVLYAGDLPGASFTPELAELLGKISVQLCVGDTAEAAVDILLDDKRKRVDAVARVVLARGTGSVLLFSAEPDLQRILPRELPSQRFDAVAREQAGQIIFTSVESMLAGQQLGITKSDFVEKFTKPKTVQEPPPPPPPVATPSGKPWSAEAQVLVGGAASASDRFDGHVGAGAVLGLPTSFPVLIGLQGNYRINQTEETDIVDIETWAVEVGATLSTSFDLGSSTSLRPGVGFAFSWVRFSPKAVEGSLFLPASSETQLVPLANGRVDVVQKLSSALSLIFTAEAAVAITKARPVAMVADGSDVVSTSWRVMPRAWLALGVDFGN
jgi:hypothetical protein